MKIIDSIGKMNTYSKIMRKQNKTLGFIPTMGYLHEGHLSLIRTARKQSDVVVASIFVNPTQFGPDEDYKKYPRDIEKDESLTKTSGVDVLFCPTPEEMYPLEFSTWVSVKGPTDNLCGKSRPEHFKGVTTVVMKLFNVIRPDIVYFGQKDAQQAFVIKKMIEDLNLDIIMKILPTIREENGLAMSSRNTYLTKSQKIDANLLNRSLKIAEKLVNDGCRSAKKIVKTMRDLLLTAPTIKIDYIAVTDTKELKNISELKGEALISLAVFVGSVRLIDNVIVNIEKPANTKRYEYDKAQ